ncbi:MAG: AAA family ATPase [Planctomycetota bacterium]
MIPESDPIIDALRDSLSRDPKNSAVWVHLGELLANAGRPEEAVEALRNAVELGDVRPESFLTFVELLRKTGSQAEALIRCEKRYEETGDLSLALELVRIHASRGQLDTARSQFEELGDRASDSFEAVIADVSLPQSAGMDAERISDRAAEVPEVTKSDPEPETDTNEDRRIRVTREDEDLDEWASQFDWGDLHTSFADVAGLDDVKRQIRLRIIAPLENPELYQAFQRTAGGGILLYGPPGCGKTHIARATAGEVNAAFVSVGIHEIVDEYFGRSEKAIHALFEEARRRAPTVLFFDEFDALGSSRGSSGQQFWRVMVDQLLQEMDGMSGRNDNVLVFAATNVPWNVDSAFRRPGRFDRLFFVPPPDREARRSILERHAGKLPGGDAIEVDELARKTSLFTGADLVSLCQRASEDALERSLETGNVTPVKMRDFERELARMDSSASEWLATAKNHARFANEGGQYDDLTDFLKRAKKW